MYKCMWTCLNLPNKNSTQAQMTQRICPRMHLYACDLNRWWSRMSYDLILIDYGIARSTPFTCVLPRAIEERMNVREPRICSNSTIYIIRLAGLPMACGEIKKRSMIFRRPLSFPTKWWLFSWNTKQTCTSGNVLKPTIGLTNDSRVIKIVHGM